MSLFTLGDITTLVPITDDGGEEPLAFGINGPVEMALGMRNEALATKLTKLEAGQTLLLPTRGKWSLHHMIQHVTAMVGPSEVTICTWGLTENPLRQVLHLVDAGAITKLNMLIDRRTKAQSPQAFQLLMESAIQSQGRIVVRATNNHSKMVLWLHGSMPVAIVTSANLTVNDRLETYMLLTQPDVAIWLREVLQLELQGDQPFHDED